MQRQRQRERDIYILLSPTPCESGARGNPKPYTLHPKPYTLNPKPYARCSSWYGSALCLAGYVS